MRSFHRYLLPWQCFFMHIDTIRSGQYPITTQLYAVTLADNPNENVELFLDWMTSPQGQQIVSDIGYRDIKP